MVFGFGKKGKVGAEAEASPEAALSTGADTTPEKSKDAKPPQEPPVPLGKALGTYFRLLFFASPTWLDIALVAVGTVAAAASGVPFPLMGILFGELVDDMNGATCDAQSSASSRPDPFAYEPQINDKVLKLVYIAVGALVLIYTYVLCWSLVSQRLAARLRDAYFRSLLRQEPAFFDDRRAGEVSSRLHGDIQAVQSGTSEKVGILIASVSFFVTAYVAAFIKEASLAGMLVSLVPAFMIMAMIGAAFIQKFSGVMSDATAAASSIASEALSHVGIVQAFGAAPRLEAKFAGHMRIARAAGIKKAIAAAVQAGGLYFIAYSANSLAFWQGSRKVAALMEGRNDGASIGRIYTVVFILVDACIVLGSVAPLLPLFGGASSAFQRLLKDIEHRSVIDGTSEAGENLPFDTPGSVAFNNVSFAYPSRPNHLVLRNINLTFPAGKHTAIVGLSGSGKSTIAALVARLQDPTDGSVTLDGHDIKELNVKNLRSFISLVQQEPSLLDRSILENIALGLVSSPQPAHAGFKKVLESSELSKLAAEGRNIPSAAANKSPELQPIVEAVRQAADLADVSSFIDRLENGYGTSAGSGGALVSGGQRQRVALARALVRDPKILVLDEATASLDSASERRIQAAIERVAVNRTVISIAHRLSTIKNADNIVVMESGQVVEQGTYAELMALDGAFARMANLQKVNAGAKDDTMSLGSTIDNDSIDGITSEKGGPAATGVKEQRGADEPQAATEQSPGSDTEAAKDTEESQDPVGKALKLMCRLVRPALLWLTLAMIAAFIVGCTFSASGIIFGFTVGELNPCNNTVDRVLRLGKFFGGMLFMLAGIEFFANFFAWTSFGVVAERLLYAVRVLSFRSLMEQGVEWHQSANRDPSKLLSIITKDSAAIGGFSGSVIGTVFSIVVNFLVAIVLSHIIAWKIAIVCLVTVPILLGSGIMQLRALAKFEERHNDAYSQAIGIAVEAVGSMKTVSALSLESEIMGKFSRALKAPRKEMLFASAYTNIWLAISNSTGFLIYAFAYWWGSQQIMKSEATQKQFFIVLVAMLVSAQLWGQMFSLAPEFSRARTAAGRISAILSIGSSKDLPPDVMRSDKPSEPKEKDPEATVESKPRVDGENRGVSITFDHVSFSYPARPDNHILHDMSFTVHPGQFCGLVGPSGAGKSTVMSLVQQLYHPTTGIVRIDGIDVSRRNDSDATASALRDEIAIVPQDSALFDGSARFNVGLGARPGHDATLAEIEEACRLANIHDVIMELPQGYDTELGPGASRLSGGQRQRLAIARALVRKPRLLLLDESTSALDAESERALQEGLERAARGVTVLAITHRLHTVQQADVIFVIEGGEVVDKGRHAELMERSETYMLNAQSQMLHD
ncbi:uncharacterized protein E0L32_011197 [Thyridium curvatum]|uniref:Leptomycin B resistance protein pmd1 n=1 Tax=Thyridium curvatum TaxID=1093900 RepID=A0A507BJS8_9PEZI|nr:uncharacterized protein E0L32_011197 [Thyridium curvatum]TPX19124.1 hypothetical protein E0L32_011197 [Thyridium curvatum]